MSATPDRPAAARKINETEALRRITSRLRAQFPELGADQIEQVVHGKYQD